MPNTQTAQLILASASPRRRELLQQMQLDFHVHVVEIDESVLDAETSESYVERMAKEKAYAAYQNLRNEHKKFGQLLVLAADTTVVCNQHILGKPIDKDDARKHLQLLSGNTHKVLSSVALAIGDEQNNDPDIQTVVSNNQVEFTQISDKQIEAYLNTDEPYDKAGSYAVQGLAAQFIKRIEGSYSGIMGLPIFETSQLLQPHGYLL